MIDKKKNLLAYIVPEYVKTFHPVSSGLLVKKFHLNISPATVRYQMAVLEKDHYIYRPHISAGGIPTEKGYNFYVKNFLKKIKFSENKFGILKKIKNKFKNRKEKKIKEIAKKVAEISQEAVIVLFNQEYAYITGLTNLANKPEFKYSNFPCQLFSSLDYIEEKSSLLFQRLEEGEKIKILIGQENPLGKECSIIFTPCRIFPEEKSLFSLVGPMRMDYDNNVALIEYISNLL